MMLSKNFNKKKCAPKLIFFNEKKIEKDSDNFWYRKLTLKVKRLGDFALFNTSPLTRFSKFNSFLWVCWFLGKNLSNPAHLPHFCSRWAILAGLSGFCFFNTIVWCKKTDTHLLLHTVANVYPFLHQTLHKIRSGWV